MCSFENIKYMKGMYNKCEFFNVKKYKTYVMLTTALNVRNAPRNASDATHTLYITSKHLSSSHHSNEVLVLESYLDKNFLLIFSLSLFIQNLKKIF